jgi:hypothetical protein
MEGGPGAWIADNGLAEACLLAAVAGFLIQLVVITRSPVVALVQELKPARQ